MGIFVRGLAMGAVETMPGVSGGTIAFITGIYDELVKTIASFADGSASILFRDGWQAFARRHNLGFLVVLGAGMVVSLLVFANVFDQLLRTHESYVMAFFFGLIAGSVFHVGAESTWRWLLSVGIVGLAVGIVVGRLPSAALGDGDPSAVTIFLAGALASTAWILPGVSGAFILVLLGLYKPMVAAVTNAELAVLATFAAGMAVGLVGFSKALAWLLDRVRGPMVALLTGFMAGSLPKLWPWQATPAEEPFVAGTVAVMAFGAFVILLVAVLAKRAPARAGDRR